MSTGIEVSVDGGLQTIRFARPEKKNALTPSMYTAITEALVRGDASPDVVAHLFIGSGGIFCAGNDINDFVERARTGATLDRTAPWKCCAFPPAADRAQQVAPEGVNHGNQRSP